ncbi:MAG: threonine/serine exporter family protein [Firmicutes bacterium]|nr:threonine/serine exporter family protein [Bacillota bacterium]
MNYLTIFILSSLAGLGFCFIFTVKKRNILICALCSGLAWTSLKYLESIGVSTVFASLVSAFILGIITEIAAVKLKSPAINFMIIGFIPLVPGLKCYQGILRLIEGNQAEGTALLFEAIFIAIAISISFLLTSSIVKMIRQIKARKK